MSARVFFLALLLTFLLAAADPAGRAAAQTDHSPPRHSLTIRRAVGAAFLHPVTPGSLAQGVPGFRLSHLWGLHPGLGVEASLLQAGGGSVILQGGGFGVRWTRAAGPFLLRPAAEIVAGRGIVDAGGWYVDTGSGSVYQPFRRPSSTPALGAGALMDLEWLHGSAWGARLIVGYWHMALPEMGGALMVGGGIQRGFRDAPWYWRTSGNDDAPPRFAVLAPAADGDGIRTLDASGLALTASDRSGVREIRVDGVPVDLVPAPDGAAEVAGVEGPAVRGVLQPAIHEGTHPLRVQVTDGAGNTATTVVEVTGSTAPPLSLVITGQDGAAVETSFVDLSGFIEGASPEVRVEVDGCVASAYEAELLGTPGHEFRLRVPLVPGDNAVSVTVSDPLAGFATAERRFRYVPTDAAIASGDPRLVVRTRRSLSGRSLRVSGSFSDGAGGLRELTAGGEPAAVHYPIPSRERAEFMAFIPAEGDRSAPIVATAMGGRVVTGEASASVSTDRRPRGAAVLVGIGGYADSRLTGPPGSEASARAVAEALMTRGVAEFTPDRVRVLTGAGATADSIRLALQRLAATDADLVFVYLAGRAVRDAAGLAAGLIPSGVHATYGPGSIPWWEIERLVGTSPGEVVVVTDLAAGDGSSVAPPRSGRCGVDPLPRGGMVVLSATGPADGSFAAAVLGALAGETPLNGDTLRLADLISSLSHHGGGGALRTSAPLYDPMLPLTRVRP